MKRGKGDKKGTKNRDVSGQVVPLTEPVVVATPMVGTRSWIGGLFTRSSRRQDKSIDYTLSPLQEERLQKLQDRLLVPFEETRIDHQVCFRRLLLKQRGDRAKWEYPFAVAGINISFMLIQMLDLQNTRTYVHAVHASKPKCLPGMNFLKLLEEDENAFDVLYCIAFAMMDAQWLAMHASYMEFNEVLQATRNQLERELSLDDTHRIQDLPAYNLLFQ
ncbi:hypothetical protein Bca101_068831 [Brassica carinata]